MRWDKEDKCVSEDTDIMSHHTDGEAWKALDHFDTEFARDPKSVRLGLLTNGFNLTAPIVLRTLAGQFS
jgi:hypothetical protein